MKSVLDRRLFDAHINLDDLTPEQHAILTQQRDERTKHLDQMVLFVLELRQLHKNVLQAASCSGEYPFNSEECTEECHDRLNRLLSSLLDPQELCGKN